MTHPRLLVIAGPTAVGKSSLALRVAERVPSEMISVDSMQVYRGMDIGTAKPSLEERTRVPHHLVDVADITESFDAARFVRMARSALQDIQSRGRMPILCGGTGFYLSALFLDVVKAPVVPSEIRAQVESTDLAVLLEELQQKDPAGFQAVDKENPRRIRRAVEVIRSTGQPYSSFKNQNPSWPPEVVAFGCFRHTDDLKTRIDQRVDQMASAGLLSETQQLLEKGLVRNRVAMQAIGYRQMVEHLEGQRSYGETIDLIKLKTRQFAKRQMTWFRKQMPLEWMNLSEVDQETAVQRVLSQVERRAKGVNLSPPGEVDQRS